MRSPRLWPDQLCSLSTRAQSCTASPRALGRLWGSFSREVANSQHKLACGCKCVLKKPVQAKAAAKAKAAQFIYNKQQSSPPPPPPSAHSALMRLSWWFGLSRHDWANVLWLRPPPHVRRRLGAMLQEFSGHNIDQSAGQKRRWLHRCMMHTRYAQVTKLLFSRTAACSGSSLCMPVHACMCACACVHDCVRVRACVRVCVRQRVRACVPSSDEAGER